MRKIRRSKRCSLAGAAAAVLVLVLATACAEPAPNTLTAADLEKMPRKPDGVALDLPPAVPSSQERAPARGVVSLREPLSDERASEVVHAYLAAFVREDAEALAQMLAPDAISLDTRQARGALIESFRTRFRNFDYAKMGKSELFDPSAVERYGFDDVTPSSRPPRPPNMREDDLLLRVPIHTPRVAGERFFGDYVLLLLRREGSTYRIAGVGEEDAP